MKSLVAIRHVAFEDLGAFEPALRDAGYAIRYCDIALDDPAAIGSATDVLVVLGGPIGAYEDDKYPFIIAELRLIERRIAAGRPTLGICLGAQLIARAMGAKVYPGKAKEIGWGPINLTQAGRASCLNHFAEVPVLHWHGDTFDLPEGTQNLASTPLTPYQAFTAGIGTLALQFHTEVEERALERWLIGHTLEISLVPGISVNGLREQARALAAQTNSAGLRMLRDWLAGLPADQ
jgi:GMP synthase (glutamine-hydrolysing)